VINRFGDVPLPAPVFCGNFDMFNANLAPRFNSRCLKRTDPDMSRLLLEAGASVKDEESWMSSLDERRVEAQPGDDPHVGSDPNVGNDEQQLIISEIRW
jgi:hypothetical protein